MTVAHRRWFAYSYENVAGASGGWGRRQLGQLLWVGFEGTKVTPSLARLLGDVSPGGVILFGRNLTEDPRQIRSLTDAIYQALPEPPFIALDQEGGRVSRLRAIVGPTSTAAALASRTDACEAVRRHSEATALALRCLGFNVNFAPVLDLSRPESRNGIGDRAFDDRPRRVSVLAGLFAATHLRAGVAVVGKHFPGLGGADADTHETLPVIRRSRALLLRQDLLPYRRLGRVLPMVMIGHACYPALQGRADQPATLAPSVVGDLLRRRLAYRGLILTDDLEMGAVDQSADAGEVALAAFAAGNDGLMYCRSEERIRRAIDALERAVNSGRVSEARVRESLRRIRAAKRRFLDGRRRGRFSRDALAQARTKLQALSPARLAGHDPTART